MRSVATATVCIFVLALAFPRGVSAQDSIAVVLADQAQMRDEPSINGVVRAVLVRGDTVKVRRRDGYWVFVSFATREGFIRLAQLSDLFVQGGAPAAPKPEPTPSPVPVPVAVPVPTTPTPAPSTLSTTVPAVAPTTPRPTPPPPRAPESRVRPTMRVEVGMLQQRLVPPAPSAEQASTTADARWTEDANNGIGFDAQLRARAGIYSLGAGYVRTSHSQKGTDYSITWSGPFVEPRIDLPLSKSLELMLGARAGLLAGSSKGGIPAAGADTRSEVVLRARQITGVFGLRLHLSNRVGIDLEGGYGTLPIRKAETRVISTGAGERVERRTTVSLDRSGTVRLLRAGLSIGF